MVASQNISHASNSQGELVIQDVEYSLHLNWETSPNAREANMPKARTLTVLHRIFITAEPQVAKVLIVHLVKAISSLPLWTQTAEAYGIRAIYSRLQMII